MLAPLVMISLTLLILIQMYSYSSLIFMFSIHMSYCMIDVFLVALAFTSKFKYVQNMMKDYTYIKVNQPKQIMNNRLTTCSNRRASGFIIETILKHTF